MNVRTQNLCIAFVLGSLVAGIGALEGWYQEYIYGADGIAYFDMADCITRGDWAQALNPYWSIGYPLLLAGTRWMFPAGWAGEWTNVRAVNLVSLMVMYGSFLRFIRVAASYVARVSGETEAVPRNRGLDIVGTLIFIEWQVQGRIISRTTPDLMVCTLFFLLMTACLQFCLRPTVKTALLIGLFAGLGFVVKAIFLPLSLIVLAVFTLRIITQPGTNRLKSFALFLWLVPATAIFAVPYIAGMSWALGRLTLGESGKLNYAWTVNKLDHWHWTGGSESFGAPIHGPRLLSENPHVYEFAEPMHVTYPVFFNPYYWYEGYHPFFNLHNQIAAIKMNVFDLTTLFVDTPHAPIKAGITIALLAAAAFMFADARSYGRRLLALWPLYLPAVLGIGLYMLVWMEVRYIVAFIIVLLMTPLLALFAPTALVSKRVGMVVLILVSLVSLYHLGRHTKPFAERLLRNEYYFTSDEDWRVGLALAAQTPPGTKVAMVKVERAMQTTWAYVAGLHVVGQIGNQDFTKKEQKQEFQLFLDHPDVQQKVFDLFRKSGATLVVALEVPGSPQGEGWVQLPGTDAWVHRL